MEDIITKSRSGFLGILDNLKVRLQPNGQQVVLQYADSPASPGAGGMQTAGSASGRQELIAKLISTCLGLAVSFTITYFGFKYLANVLDPTRQEKKEAQKRAEKLMKRIGVDGVKLSEYELCIASNLVDPLSMVISWQDIGGLEDTVLEIQETIILPFAKQELFQNSSLLQPPKGVLLYGPPGCGKTMIAKAMARAAGARFINLQVSSLVDKWYGESQKRAEAVFSLAIKLQPTIIFIDEIDSFLRSRTSSDHEATVMIKTQFMSFWDGLMTDSKCRVMIVGATNRPQDVDAAILRRMPSMFRIGLPDTKQRRHVLGIILEHEHTSDNIDLQQLAEQTRGFSGSDLRELCRSAAIYRIRDYIRAEQQQQEECDQQQEQTTDDEGNVYTTAPLASPELELRPLTMNDLERSLAKIHQSKMVSLVAAQHVELD